MFVHIQELSAPRVVGISEKSFFFSAEQMAGMCVVNADEATMLRSRFWLSRKIGPTSFLFCGVVPLIYGLLLLLAHTNALK